MHTGVHVCAQHAVSARIGAPGKMALKSRNNPNQLPADFTQWMGVVVCNIYSSAAVALPEVEKKDKSDVCGPCLNSLVT